MFETWRLVTQHAGTMAAFEGEQSGCWSKKMVELGSYPEIIGVPNSRNSTGEICTFSLLQSPQHVILPHPQTNLIEIRSPF